MLGFEKERRAKRNGCVCGLKRMKYVGSVEGERDENGEEGGEGVGFYVEEGVRPRLV